MYSGHVHPMAGMFGVLYDDARYEQKDSLVFDYKPMAASMRAGSATTLTSLNDTILWQMQESGYLGVACEPNMVFIVCNEYPLLGFRFHDIRKGTANAPVATRRLHAGMAKNATCSPTARSR